MSTVSAVVANVWRFLVFVIAVAICLGIIGINLTPLLASATIIGATLGFGAQLIVRDYFSGFLLTLEDQYGIGDTITVGTVSGVVEDLTLRVTSVRAVDGTVYTIANGDIRQLANVSRGRAQAVVDLTLPGSSATDLPCARAVIEEAARRVAGSAQFAGHATEPPVLVTLIASTESTLTLRLTLHTVPGQRDAARRAPCARRPIVDLSRAELWPAPMTDPEPPPGTPPSSRAGDRRHAAAIAACHMTSTGTGRPVHISNCAAAWCTSIPNPSTVVAPASAAAASQGVGVGRRRDPPPPVPHAAAMARSASPRPLPRSPPCPLVLR